MQDGAPVNASGKNAKAIHCKYCNEKILLANVGTLVNDKVCY